MTLKNSYGRKMHARQNTSLFLVGLVYVQQAGLLTYVQHKPEPSHRDS